MEDDVIERLERLASLRQKGLLTDAEFQEQKGVLLKRDKVQVPPSPPAAPEIPGSVTSEPRLPEGEDRSETTIPPTPLFAPSTMARPRKGNTWKVYLVGAVVAAGLGVVAISFLNRPEPQGNAAIQTGAPSRTSAFGNSEEAANTVPAQNAAAVNTSPHVATRDEVISYLKQLAAETIPCDRAYTAFLHHYNPDGRLTTDVASAGDIGKGGCPMGLNPQLPSLPGAPVWDPIATPDRNSSEALALKAYADANRDLMNLFPCEQAMWLSHIMMDSSLWGNYLNENVADYISHGLKTMYYDKGIEFRKQCSTATRTISEKYRVKDVYLEATGIAAPGIELAGGWARSAHGLIGSPGTPPRQPVTGPSIAPPSSRPTVITQPDWLQRPSADDVARYYPDRAQRMRVDGRAVIACQVLASGGLTGCSVDSEEPTDEGFGDAALKLAMTFRMSPLTKNGVPTDGGTVRIPINFALPGAVVPGA